MRITSNDAEQSAVLQIANMMTSAAKSALNPCGYLPNCKLMMAISVSAYSKNIYYDRKMPELHG